jgi:hypothetical protein
MKTKKYFVAFAIYWGGFGLVTTFYPDLMDLFLSDKGVTKSTEFSNHVWMHGGIDILALVIILLALSRETLSKNTIVATAFAALLPTIAIFYSLLLTPYWSALFIVSGLGTLFFFIWGLTIGLKK